MDSTYTQLPAELVEKLKAPLPAEAIAPHPTKKDMSTINPVFMTERLNEVFGFGGYNIKTRLVSNEILNGLLREEKENAAKDKYVQWTALADTELTIPRYGISYNCIASSSNQDVGDACKGATTDALTKICGMYLGIGTAVWKDKKKNATPYKKAPEPVLAPLHEETKFCQVEGCGQSMTFFSGTNAKGPWTGWRCSSRIKEHSVFNK